MRIQGPAHIHRAQTIHGPHRAAATQSNTATLQVTGPDEVEISQHAELVSRVHDLPEIRTDRVTQLRAAIASGDYDTDEKLDLALDRLLAEIG